MAKITSIIMEVVYALLFTVIGYVITSYFMTTVADSMEIELPSYFTTLGLGIVFIIIFFAIVIYVITGAMKHGSKD